MSIPTYLPYYVLASSALIMGALLLGLCRSLKQTTWASQDKRRTLIVAAAVLIGWFILSATLGVLKVYEAVADGIPTIQYGILLPILLGGVVIARSSAVGRVLDAVPLQWLTGVQLYRALGGIFLVLYGAGQLPGLFAWPAGLGDVLVGVLAPVVALAYARGPGNNGDLVAAWNIFGLLDLIVAVGCGFATSPSPVQLAAFDRPNELITAFPLVLIPTYLVPVSVLLHLVSLAKLRRTVRHQGVQLAM
ncbi:MAG: hypothetical protein U0236_12360 [Nitrospira sp.]